MEQCTLSGDHLPIPRLLESGLKPTFFMLSWMRHFHYIQYREFFQLLSFFKHGYAPLRTFISACTTVRTLLTGCAVCSPCSRYCAVTSNHFHALIQNMSLAIFLTIVPCYCVPSWLRKMCVCMCICVYMRVWTCKDSVYLAVWTFKGTLYVFMLPLK